MQRQARSQSTLVGAFMILAAMFSATAHAEGWGPKHGYSEEGSVFESGTNDRGPYIGVHLWSQNNLVSAIQFRTTYTNVPWTSVYGYSGAQDHGVTMCGNGGPATVVGIYGKAGYYVDALGLLCDTGNHVFRQPNPPVGGTGGEEFVDRCPPGERVIAFKGRAGAWMDQIQIYCGRY